MVDSSFDTSKIALFHLFIIKYTYFKGIIGQNSADIILGLIMAEVHNSVLYCLWVQMHHLSFSFTTASTFF